MKYCGIHIEISYFIDSNRESVFISKSDTRTQIINLKAKEFEFVVN